MGAAQATDREIDAALEAVGEAPMTPAEIHQVVEIRLAGRADMRLSILDAITQAPQVARARALLTKVLDSIEAKVNMGQIDLREEIALTRLLAKIAIIPEAKRIDAALEIGRQHLGYTSRGYDEDLRKLAEEAEIMAAAEREEQRRSEIEDAN